MSLIKLSESSTGFSQQYNGLKELGKSVTNKSNSTYKIDFATAFSGLKSYSAAQYAKKDTGVTVTKNTSGDKNNWSIDIKCAAGSDVVNLTADELENCTLNITGTGSATLIINVTGTSSTGSYTFNKKVTVDGVTGGYDRAGGKVLFNFGSDYAGTATFQESTTGAILAPSGTIKIASTHNGSVYADTVENTNGEIHENPFTPGDDPAEGSITVNKTVTGTASITKDYYVTLFSDKDCAKKIETKTISIKNGASGSATFSGLKAGSTYYVAETDADGSLISSSNVSTLDISGYKFDAENSTLTAQAITLASTSGATATADITNAYTRNKGSLTITKKVAGAGDVTKTFYAGVFSDEACTKLIGSAHEIAVTNGTSGSVTVSDLPAGETYYIAETDKDGNALTTSSDELSVGSQYELQTINYSGGTQAVTLGASDGSTADKTITNTYIKKTEEAKITVTKTITGIAAADMTGKDGTIEIDLYQGGSVTGTPFRTATITIKDGTAQSTAVFDKLTPGTYTVAEKTSTAALPGDYSLKAVTVDNAGSVTLAGSDEKTVGITNEYAKQDTPTLGAISVTKLVTIGGDSSVITPISSTFYVTLFRDAACTQKVSGTSTQAITVTDGVATNTANFTSLTPGTYYVAETDASGSTVYTSAPAVTGYTPGTITGNMSAVSVTAGSTASATITNDYTIYTPPITPPDSPKNPKTPKTPTTPTTPGSSADTGDNWNGGLWGALALTSAALAAVLLLERKKRSAK
jgi:hypothetical protein